MEDTLQLLTKKKQELDSLQPIQKELKDNLNEWFKVELTYSSNAIEGNTLSRIETAEVIEKGVQAVISGKPLKDQLEAANHAKALDFIQELASIRKGHQFITEEDILAIHKIILTSIIDAWAGRYRKSEVFIRGSNTDFPLPNAVPYKMKEFIQWLQAQQDEHPVRIAANAHYKFVSVHPFIDGNGRTSRLLMNLILIMNGYPMAVIRFEDRVEYLKSLETAQTKGDLQPFYDIVEKAAGRSLDSYIHAAKNEPALTPFKTKTDRVEAKDILKIGELAKATGVSEHTIRFWTEEGLLQVTRTTTGNYRLYDSAMIDIIKEIQRLKKELRLTLPEIKGRLEKFGASITI